RLYNLVPPHGMAAQFGTNLQGLSVTFDAHVRTGEGYGVITDVRNIPAIAAMGSVVTLWGVPGDPSHDRWRGVRPGGCSVQELNKEGNECPTLGSRPVLKPFWRLPTSCAGPQLFPIEAQTWEGV